MQGKSLSTDEVVTRSDALGDGERALPAVGVEDLGSPGSGGARVAILSNLEERTGGGGLCVGDLGHVDEDGAVVGTADSGLGALAVARLGMHLDSERAARCDESVRCSW